MLAAIRTARTVKGRDKIVSFSNDYHGIFDEVLVKGVNVRGEIRPQPVAPGIPRAAVQNVVVMEYGADASLDAIREQATSSPRWSSSPSRAATRRFSPRSSCRSCGH